MSHFEGVVTYIYAMQNECHSDFVKKIVFIGKLGVSIGGCFH